MARETLRAGIHAVARDRSPGEVASSGPAGTEDKPRRNAAVAADATDPDHFDPWAVSTGAVGSIRESCGLVSVRSPDRHLTRGPSPSFIPRLSRHPEVPLLKVGDVAPDFELRDEAGKLVRLSGLRGRSVVLFFYPDDDTPVCTQQACSFRDEFDGFAKADVVVFGISPDDVVSHRAFKKKFNLPFGLLSDPSNKVAQRYGSFGEKLMYGRKVQGTIRSSILIDPGGRILSIHRNVRSAGNGARMLRVLSELDH
jgi:peroxiredoxin Q/BCP